jgi:hypothetical protein
MIAPTFAQAKGSKKIESILNRMKTNEIQNVKHMVQSNGFIL